MSRKIVIIGAGFGGLSTACYLAKAGFDVTVLEKNSQPGGRAMVLKKNGFTFDTGPSWYMMPDVIEEFFADFDRLPSDYYELVQLKPSYQIFTQQHTYQVPTAPAAYKLFESIDPGAGEALKRLLAKSKHEYELVRKGMLPPSGLSNSLKASAKLLGSNPGAIGSYHSRVARYVSHSELQKILEFMTVFIGGNPKDIPALYTLLTHVDMGLGTWYPIGGMGKLVEAMVHLGRELGVKYRYNHEVIRIHSPKQQVTGVETTNGMIKCDVVVANADYHHVETSLLEDRQRSITESSWERKALSPSCLVACLGVRKKLPNLLHHNLFFDTDWDAHLDHVFRWHRWTNNPMFYVCNPSKTDPSVAPNGMENLFILAPQSVGKQPSSKVLKSTLTNIIGRIEHKIGTNFANDIVTHEVRAQDYFEHTFHAYKGNAFGLSHTLRQTAIFRPPVKSRSVGGLYFTGQYTLPGTGVPIVILSGKVVGNLVTQEWQKK